MLDFKAPNGSLLNSGWRWRLKFTMEADRVSRVGGAGSWDRDRAGTTVGSRCGERPHRAPQSSSAPHRRGRRSDTARKARRAGTPRRRVSRRGPRTRTTGEGVVTHVPGRRHGGLPLLPKPFPTAKPPAAEGVPRLLLSPASGKVQTASTFFAQSITRVEKPGADRLVGTSKDRERAAQKCMKKQSAHPTPRFKRRPERRHQGRTGRPPPLSLRRAAVSLRPSQNPRPGVPCAPHREPLTESRPRSASEGTSSPQTPPTSPSGPPSSRVSLTPPSSAEVTLPAGPWAAETS